MTRPRWFTASLFILIAACSAGARPEPTIGLPPSSEAPATTIATPDLTLPGPSDEVILVVGDEGGFVPVEYLAQRLPRFQVMADGRLFFQGAVPAIFPGPAVPNVQMTQLSAAEVGTLIRIAEDMGLDKMVDEANREAADRVADATDTFVTFYDEAGEHRFSVYALGLVTAGDDRVRQLEKLITQLDGLTASGESVAYVPERFRVYVLDAPPGSDPQFRNVQIWPLALDPRTGDPAFLGWPCTVVDGDDAALLHGALAQANQTTLWNLDGAELGIIVRPMLPGDEGCAS
ncbi:MAG: hypothetical protein OEO77_02355 [Acidimicrobiia bacterium]|nr:hypothetical protein [Acidimicrobiia bacterium]